MTTNGGGDRHVAAIGMDGENADHMRLYATGKHVRLQEVYAEILPLMRNFFIEAERGDSSIGSRASKYLRLPEDVVTTFVNDAVGGITLNDKSRLLTSLVVYVIFVGSVRVQRVILASEINGTSLTNQSHRLDKALALHNTRYKDVMQAVEYVVDFFAMDKSTGLRIKSDSELENENKNRVDFALKVHRLLGTIYLRLLLPGYEFKDVIFQHLYILNGHAPRDKLRVNTGVDPMTEGVLIHCYVLKQVALHRAWRMVHPPRDESIDGNRRRSADYDEAAILQRYQDAKEMMDRFTNADYPCVFRSLSEWT